MVRGLNRALDVVHMFEYTASGTMADPNGGVQKVDGRIIADLTVTEALANPYLIFPPPRELLQKSRRS
jgi:hypothetical protein